MATSWIVTLPPIIVLVIALITRNVLYSLLGGIISACAIITHGNIGAAAQKFAQTILQESSILDLINTTGNYDHAYLIGFLICLGIIIELMTHSDSERHELGSVSHCSFLQLGNHYRHPTPIRRHLINRFRADARAQRSLYALSEALTVSSVPYFEHLFCMDCHLSELWPVDDH